MIFTSVLYESNRSCSNRFSLYPAEHAAREENETLMKINLNLAWSEERVSGEVNRINSCENLCYVPTGE